MRILAISEHFHPRVAGTTEYADQTCQALASRGHEVHLLVPGSNYWNEQISGFTYQVTALGVGWPKSGDPDRGTRYQFAKAASEIVTSSAAESSIDVVHILFGQFVGEVLCGRVRSSHGLPLVATIHNVPPHECSRSWEGDLFPRRVIDWLRMKAVDWKNTSRFKDQSFDAYVTPSEAVTCLLREKLSPESVIHTISHGYSDEFVDMIDSCQTSDGGLSQPVRLLTVGGWVPHKRQHLIPEVAQNLKRSGISFEWNVIGPPGRIRYYHDAVVSEIERRDLKARVHARGAVSHEELSELYLNSNIYVQPSTEEGFCMSALNAAAIGLPVIGSPAGALPSICEISEGALVPSNVDEIYQAILHFINASLWQRDPAPIRQHVRTQFTWAKAAERLAVIYEECRTF
ncbi:MAG: glycosyltransferase family 4 protein [Verrucomicrobiota bacterium]